MKQVLLFLCALTLGLASSGQDSAAYASSADTSATSSSTVTIGISVASNTSYYGQQSIEAMPYAATVLSWRHRSGLYANLLGYRLLKNAGDGVASAYGGAMGFEVAMKRNWSIDAGYGYTYFPKHSPFLQAANPHSLTFAIAKQSVLNTRLEGNYNFGHTSDFFATFALSKAISITHNSSAHIVVFTPQVDITAGTQQFYTHYLTAKNIRDSLTGAILDPIFGGGNQTDTVAKSVTHFNVLSYNLTLPISYQTGGLLFELSTQLSLLSKHTRSKPRELNTFFTASVYYQL